jgi:hypothetical protein
VVWLGSGGWLALWSMIMLQRQSMLCVCGTRNWWLSGHGMMLRLLDLTPFF